MDNDKKENLTPKFEKDWRKRFEIFASTHDDDAGIAGWSETGLQVRLQAFLRVWNGNDLGDMWLDAGCGAGTYSRHLREIGKKVVGVDYSFPTIRKAKNRLNSEIVLAVADVTVLPFNNNVFDGAICFGVMQALERPQCAIRNLKSVVQPQGEVWIDSLNKWCLPNIWTQVVRKLKKRPAHLHYYSPAEMEKHAKESGLSNVKRYWLPILPYRFKKFQRVFESQYALWAINNIPFLGMLISHSFIIKGKVS